MKFLHPLFCLVLLLAPVCQAQDVNDSMIVDRVVKAIQNNEELADADILVVSVNGWVMLAGQVLNEDQKNQAAVAAAFATNAMRRLINELVVVDAIDHSFDNDDADLLERILAAIGDMSDETRYIIHDGTVHLMGNIPRAEGEAVANTIAAVPGVKEIRVSYEYQ